MQMLNANDARSRNTNLYIALRSLHTTRSFCCISILFISKESVDEAMLQGFQRSRSR